MTINATGMLAAKLEAMKVQAPKPGTGAGRGRTGFDFGATKLVEQDDGTKAEVPLYTGMIDFGDGVGLRHYVDVSALPQDQLPLSKGSAIPEGNRGQGGHYTTTRAVRLCSKVNDWARARVDTKAILVTSPGAYLFDGTKIEGNDDRMPELVLWFQRDRKQATAQDTEQASTEQDTEGTEEAPSDTEEAPSDTEATEGPQEATEAPAAA